MKINIPVKYTCISFEGSNIALNAEKRKPGLISFLLALMLLFLQVVSGQGALVLLIMIVN